MLLGASPAELQPYSGGMRVQRLRKTDKGDKETHKEIRRVIPSLDDAEEKFVHRME